VYSQKISVAEMTLYLIK